MSTHSRDAQLLARVLGEHAKVPVSVTYHGPATGHHGGWHVTWCDGPTVDTMRTLAVTLAGAHSIRVPIRAYDRASTDLAEAAALLARLSAHPEEAGQVGSITAMAAYNDTDHPENLDEPTLRRARALLSLSPAGTLTLPVLDEIRRRATIDDWPGVLEWLDGTTAAAETPGVPNIADARRRREQAR